MLFPISMNVTKTLTHIKASGGLDVEGRSVVGEHCSHDSSPVINTTHTPAHTRGKTNTGPPITSVAKPSNGHLTPLNRKLIFCYLGAQMLEELNMRRGITLSLRRLKAVWGQLKPVGFLSTLDHSQGRPR